MYNNQWNWSSNSLPTNNSPESERWTTVFYQTLRKPNTSAPQTIPWCKKRRNAAKLILWSQYYSNTKNWIRTQQQKEKIQIKFCHKCRCKILNKILANQIKKLKRLSAMIKSISFQGCRGWFNLCKSIDVIQHVNRSKDQNHTIISIDAKKLRQNSASFLHKGSDENKNRPQLKPFPLKSATR
jgi:hypothetical protein